MYGSAHLCARPWTSAHWTEIVSMSPPGTAGSGSSYSLANNRVIAALPARERRVFVELLEPVSYTIKQSLYKSDELIPYIYFPLGGVFSIVSDARHGGTIELA